MRAAVEPHRSAADLVVPPPSRAARPCHVHGLPPPSPLPCQRALGPESRLRAAFSRRHMAALDALCKQHAKASGVPYLGVDTSAAPSKDAQSLCRVCELLGLDHFGAAGTLALAQLLTRLFKSFGTAQGGTLHLLGFSGFMLACLEDQGLARPVESRRRVPPPAARPLLPGGQALRGHRAGLRGVLCQLEGPRSCGAQGWPTPQRRGSSTSPR